MAPLSALSFALPFSCLKNFPELRLNFLRLFFSLVGVHSLGEFSTFAISFHVGNGSRFDNGSCRRSEVIVPGASVDWKKYHWNHSQCFFFCFFNALFACNFPDKSSKRVFRLSVQSQSHQQCA